MSFLSLKHVHLLTMLFNLTVRTVWGSKCHLHYIYIGRLGVMKQDKKCRISFY